MPLPLSFYLGGTRSGKSELAEARVRELAAFLTSPQGAAPVLYAATAPHLPGDAALNERIRRHQLRRPAHWLTLECPLHPARDIGEALARPPFRQEDGRPRPGVILLDCLALWVSNRLFALLDSAPSNASDAEAVPPDLPQRLEAALHHEIEALLALMAQGGHRFVLVSVESGLGGIGATPLTRMYADALGLVNQWVAAQAEDCRLVVAGKCLRLD